MFLNLLLLLMGFVVLIKGADFMVNGACSIAQKLKISSLVIGLTIVAFGTSAPELVVNILNSHNERNEAIFGNILGSNIFNLLFILGIAGLVHPLVVQKNSVKYEVPISLIATVQLFVLVNDQMIRQSSFNTLSRIDSVLLLLGFAVFSMYIYRSMKDQPEEQESFKEHSHMISVGLVLLGVLMLIGGGYLVTENAVKIAQQFNLSDKLIGLTILAVGTSLPELATSVVAAYRRKTDIAIGNIIGSNIFNLFFVAGINGLIRPIPFNPILNQDVYVLLGGTLMVIVSMFTFRRNKIDRREASIFVITYLAYIGYLILRN